MKDNETLLVTGASGHLGQLVLENLIKTTSKKIIATTRQPEKLARFAQQGIEVRAADFNDPASLEKAFTGADRILLISTDQIGSRTPQHKNAIEAAKKVGAKHILYTSLPQAETSVATAAPEHAETEKLIRESGLNYTFLRHNLYADLLLQSLGTAIALGTFFGSAGEGRIAYVTREDCAKAAAAALASGVETNRELDITGPDALSYKKLAQIASEASGKEIPYQNLSDADFQAALMKSGLPEVWAQVFVTFDHSARNGSLGQVSSSFKELTGQAPTKIRNFLLERKDALLKR